MPIKYSRTERGTKSGNYPFSAIAESTRSADGAEKKTGANSGARVPKTSPTDALQVIRGLIWNGKQAITNYGNIFRSTVI